MQTSTAFRRNPTRQRTMLNVNVTRPGRPSNSSSGSDSTRKPQPPALVLPDEQKPKKPDRWNNTTEVLPPRLSRRQISMMSIGGIIGTGLFLGTSDALRRGGPVGVLLGYALVGSVVYCVAVSLGEMVAYRPHVGGVIGLMDDYVDPALAFASGWLAWYHWVVICPAEISAAVTLMGFYGLGNYNAVWTTIILVLSTAVNCFGTRLYGEIEFWFSSIKVITIVALVIFGLLADFGAVGHQGAIGFRYWNNPGPFAQYMGIPGTQGRFLGFFQILMQAVFSYLGAEIPAIAASEVINPTKNIPESLKRVWSRIFILYVSGVAVMGLILSHTDPALGSGSTSSSVFVIVMQRAGIKVLPQILNAAFLMSAWSAGTVDIYVASRYLWFLAYRRHAPSFFRRLYRSRPVAPPNTPPHSAPLPAGPPPTPYGGVMEQPDDKTSTNPGDHVKTNDLDITEILATPYEAANCSSKERELETLEFKQHDLEGGRCASPLDESDVMNNPHEIIFPWVGVLVSFLVGLAAYTSIGADAKKAFSWLSSMTSAAALLSWVAMMYTYIRWHRGTKWAEAHKGDRSSNYTSHLVILESLRHRGQPYLAMYALFMSAFILICNGWATLLAGSAEGKFNIAEERDLNATTSFNIFLGNLTLIKEEFPPDNIIPTFVTTYLPIPIFLLLILGYKLINQTPMIAYEAMCFIREDDPPMPELSDRGRWERILNWLI
ncbi:hypothetical protein BOTBODRAFT_49880 [Botryobasidium botryosum FD-172 SS1]|uniref:Amino acid permease/ SLC12A domain-containing protein n=1 Tax=Botryobasidium botryosum (strain FD-172 SS1) TaxID=930990 RepID=A0A067MZL5_BOTB1|nr:hypothetical protein BOTBODRAFT_49880 [Botryobasidium botryosum FD-172 SS1]